MKVDLLKGNRRATVLAKGGTVAEFVCDGLNIIYPYTKIGEKFRGGIPICFPVFGPSPFEGVPQHGWLRDELLRESRKKEHYCSFSGFSMPKPGFPWALNYLIGVCLSSEKSLTIDFFATRGKDKQKDPVPVNVGVHTYFNNLGERAVEIDGKRMTEFNKEAKIIPIDCSKGFIIDLGQRKVKVILSGQFQKEKTQLVFWSDSENYFCAEVILTHPNVFNTPEGFFLKDHLALRYTLKVIE